MMGQALMMMEAEWGIKNDTASALNGERHDKKIGKSKKGY